MKKVLNYLLIFLGLTGMLISTPKISSNISIFNFINPKIVLIISMVLVGVGVVFSITKEQPIKSEKEVPIYKGKEIVGYRIIK